jgi:hypothetical protein
MSKVQPILRTVEQLCSYLHQQPPFCSSYALIADWLKRGQVKVSCGFDEWRFDWYTVNAWENKSWPFFFEFILKMPKADDFLLYYDARNDYHHIEFNLEGKRYKVRWYKV